MMRFEWDEGKNRRNLAKHKVSFETASLVFEDPRALSIQDRVVEGEERWQTVGMFSGTVLFVAHTYREEAGDAPTIVIPVSHRGDLDLLKQVLRNLRERTAGQVRR